MRVDAVLSLSPDHVPMLVEIKSSGTHDSFSAIVGVAFGFYPARGAARLDPIEALRAE